jgi:hypothetical protein
MVKPVRIVTWQKTHAQSIQNFAWLPIAPGKKSAERLRPRDAGLPRRALLDERPSIQLVERELKLGTGIHHDRPVPRDRLLYRLA